jgi:predicted transcriptional regulator
MRKRKQLEKLLGPLEADVMEAVWARKGAATVRDILMILNKARSEDLAYTTVMTVMARLADKGILRRIREGRGYLYEAVARDAAEIAVRRVMRDFGDSAMAHFVEEARADPRTLRRLQRLLREE